MWVDVKTIANAVGLTPRAIQVRAKKEFTWRQKNAKSIEIKVSSLPMDWQQKVIRNLGKDPAKIVDIVASGANLSPVAQLTAYSVSKPVLDGKSIDREKRRMALADTLRKQPPEGMSRTAYIREVASYHGMSESTARRLLAKSATGTSIKTRGSVTSFPPQAIAFMQAYYLKTIKSEGACNLTMAWKAVQIQAANKGWEIGSRSTAMKLLKEFRQTSSLLEAYARGGSRALDNYFYIARDSNKLLPFQIIIGDQHIFDFWVADYESGRIYRPECYLWLDMHTKLPYGIAFDKPYTSDTVKESLRMGLHHFGLPDCTYNDNGSSECSKAIGALIDDLVSIHRFIDFQDVSALHKTSDGYVIEDPDSDEPEILDIARTPEEWHRKHRRIFANVKNAKAKDIERFFRTLEGMLTARAIPGRVATPGAPAAVDEEERKRLERQKDNLDILTIEEFQSVVFGVLREYISTTHAKLGMSPVEKLRQRITEGWEPKRIDDAEIDWIMFDRKRCKVQRGRIMINKAWYIGEELRTDGLGRLADVGLYRFDGQTVEVRYDRRDLSRAYALAGGVIRPLKAVKEVTMLDDDAMVEAIATKRRQMAAVRDAFKNLTAPIGDMVMKTDRGQELRQAQKVQEALPQPVEGNLKDEVAKQIQRTRPPRVVPMKPLHAAPYERYKWCLDMMMRNIPLDQDDERFFAAYRRGQEYKQNQRYWENYEKLGGDR